MKEGLAAILEDSRCGMPKEHIKSLIDAAAHLNTAIGFRPINPLAKWYIKDGCPSKPFLVKNKTASCGPMAGLITLDPRYGKLPLEHYEKHKKTIDELLESHDNFVQMPLILPSKRLSQLVGAEEIELEMQDDGLIQIKWINRSQIMHAYARKLSEDEKSYEILAEDQSPIMVLGQKLILDETIETKPITADYDLLVVCPAWKDFEPGARDKSPLRTQGSEEAIKAAILESQDADYTGPKEEDKMGNVSPRLKDMIEIINHFIARDDPKRREKELRMVHHNAEFTNPFADELSKQLPTLIFFPESLGHQGIALIETERELMIIRNELQEKGYYWPTHAKYKEHLPSFDPKTTRLLEKHLENHFFSPINPDTSSAETSSEDVLPHPD